MFLDEIATKVAADGHASTASTSDWFLVKGELFDSAADSTVTADRMVALIENPGGPPSPRPAFQDLSLQVVVRGESISATSGAYPNARALAEAIHLDLGALGSTTLSGVHYVGVWAQQSPFFVEYDQRQRPIFSCNYRALRATTS